jgi:hypothetical protein
LKKSTSRNKSREAENSDVRWRYLAITTQSRRCGRRRQVDVKSELDRVVLALESVAKGGRRTVALSAKLSERVGVRKARTPKSSAGIAE